MLAAIMVNQGFPLAATVIPNVSLSLTALVSVMTPRPRHLSRSFAGSGMLDEDERGL